MNNATRYVPWVVTCLGMGYLLAAMAPPAEPEGQPALNRFAQLPVIDGGRIKPVDTWARVQMMILSKHQDYTDLQGNGGQPAVRWALDLLAYGLVSTYDTIPVRDPEVRAWIGLPEHNPPLYGADEVRDALGKDKQKMAALERTLKNFNDASPVEQKAFLTARLAVSRSAKLAALKDARGKRPDNPDMLKVFRIENDEVLKSLGLKPRSGLRYSFDEIVADRTRFVQFSRKVFTLREKIASKQLDEDKLEVEDAKAMELARHLSVYRSLREGMGDVLMAPGASKDRWSTLADALRAAEVPDEAYDLAVVRAADVRDRTEVATVPSRALRGGQVVQNGDLPFRIEVVRWLDASRLQDRSGKDDNPATAGFGLEKTAVPLSAKERDAGTPWPACYAKLTAPGGAELGTFLFTLLIPEQRVQVGDDKDGAYTVVLRPKRANPAAESLEKIVQSYATGDAGAFNAEVADYQQQLDARMPSEMRKARLEVWFNNFAPFFQCQCLYVLVGLLAILSWLSWPEALRRSAFFLAVGVAAVHTLALVLRMYIQGRPPVTNLYSSAVFIGWGCVLLCLAIEYLYRNGLGTACGAVLGFSTLVIAHHLGGSGDTLEMMQAVLDTNFWLATHVTTVTFGYTATFVAGIFGIVFVLLGVGTPVLDPKARKALGQIIYGVVCFATLLSFVGTVLGGIWADQSWGRFWGWDPKENGALLIVIMNAMILHARWGGLVKERGMAVLAMVGNMVTMWSWFGTNQLGIGLHAYGFNQTLVLLCRWFWVSQLGLILVGALLPLRFWWSYQDPGPLGRPNAPRA
jgi:ABC-type transport system involved in cytochrome c biogenesis permease subunit